MFNHNEKYQIYIYRADIDFCPSCKGVWVARGGEIEKIANASKIYEENTVYSNERLGNNYAQPREIR